MREPTFLCNWLEAARKKANAFKIALYCVLAAMVVLNFFILPHHPHFGMEAWPTFWAFFALIGTVVMVVVLKRIVYPILARPEEDTNDRS
jgi:drug/metabolite transporter (DMT)-like permease